MSNEIPPGDQERIAEAADKLAEHYDSVVILVTRHEASEGGTLRLVDQRGNLYANLGWAREWVMTQDCITRRRSIDHDRKRQQEEEEEE